MYRRISAICSVAALSIALMSGCEEKSKTAEPAKTEAGTVDVPAKLAKADAVDGKTDKVISKCSACSLHMDGTPAHTIEFKGYQLQFCSEDCKKSFEADTEKSVIALKLP